MNDNLTKQCVSPACTINEAMKQMCLADEKILLIIDSENRLLGTLTDGDIRKFILKTGSVKGNIKKCYNNNPIFLMEGNNYAEAKKIVVQKKIGAIPVVDKDKRIIDLLSWNKLFNGIQKPMTKINCPMVIMAGGRGERLDPFTKIFPKPLIPIGEKPVLELIMDNLNQFGVKNFYVTVNYKGDMIKSYFDNITLKYNLNYIWEKKFLGTAGSLKLLPKTFPSTFILSNCDIIVYTDYADLIKFHKKNKNDLTMIGAIQRHIIPYGVIEFSYNGFVDKINEKPEYELTINTGVYVLEKRILDYIPYNKFFHITHLMDKLLMDGKKVGMYPVSEKSYMDMGQWEEYQKSIQNIFNKTIIQ